MTKRGAEPLAAALPPCCFARSPLTGGTVGLIRGGNGYRPVISRDTPEALNATLPNPPTLAQVQAMLAGAVFGWAVPAADPASYVAPAGSQPPEPRCFRRLPEPPYGIEDWGAPDRPVQLAGGAAMHPRPTHLPDPVWILSGADLGFFGWLALVDVRIAATSPWMLLTLPVRDWREQYDGRVPPDEAADVAVDEHASVQGIPDDRDGYPPACSDPGGHSWVTIDDTGRCYCEHCRADGDG